MGDIRHHAILVTSFDEESIVNAHEKAGRIFGRTVSEINDSNMNYYRSFVVFPDGSKEGWTESDTGDKRRDMFIEYMKQRKCENGRSMYLDWIEVQYGDDNGESLVVRHSDEEDKKTKEIQ